MAQSHIVITYAETPEFESDVDIIPIRPANLVHYERVTGKGVNSGADTPMTFTLELAYHTLKAYGREMPSFVEWLETVEDVSETSAAPTLGEIVDPTQPAQ